jgi:Fe-S oxidoreductase
MRFEYPTLLGTPEAAELAKAIVDPHQVLYDLFRAGKFNRDFKSTPGKIAYHIPCHLKAQSIGLRSRDLMRRIPGVEIDTVDACTAHDGTWAMKKEFFPLSMKWGAKAFNGMRNAEPNLMATDCHSPRSRSSRGLACAHCIRPRFSPAPTSPTGSRKRSSQRRRSRKPNEAGNPERDYPVRSI